MFRKLINMLSGRGRAREPADTREGATIYVLAALQSEGLDADTMTKDQLLGEIDRAARDLNEREGIEPFMYEREGIRTLPFFSSMQHAETFCGEYSQARNRVFPFQVLGIDSVTFARLLHGCEAAVLNPDSPDEHVLAPERFESWKRAVPSPE